MSRKAIIPDSFPTIHQGEQKRGVKPMKLSVLERLAIQNLLPQQSDFTNLKLMRVAREALSFTEKENRLLQFKPVEGEAGKIQWQDGAVPEKEVALGEVVTVMIVDALKKLNEEKKLTEEHFSLYEKFVESAK